MRKGNAKRRGRFEPKDQAMLEHRYIEEMLQVPSGRCQML